MNKPRILAALGVSALAASASVPAAHAQFGGRPTGSFVQSCRNVQTSAEGYLSAECPDQQNRYRWSTIYYPQCRGDIANRNGVLSCDGATASVGPYLPDQNPGQAILGAIAGAIFGGAVGQELYAPGYQYPGYGQPGYGDPRYDPRFGEAGWGYGRTGQWVPIAQRQEWLDRRIMQGERDGSLTRSESADLRAELANLIRLEATYSRNGLTNAERADLDVRFDALSARIRLQRQDGQTRPGQWQSINERQANLDARIDAGVRDRSLSPQEAARLRAEFDDLARLEADYRRGGLTAVEQADLDRRFDVLSARIRNDRQDGPGGARAGAILTYQADIDARLDAAVRARTMSAAEAARIRTEFEDLARIEANYGWGGLTNAERADLDRRFNALDDRIRAFTR